MGDALVRRDGAQLAADGREVIDAEEIGEDLSEEARAVACRKLVERVLRELPRSVSGWEIEYERPLYGRYDSEPRRRRLVTLVLDGDLLDEYGRLARAALGKTE